jgi:hypothetical protein
MLDNARIGPILWNETLLDHYWEKTANINAEAQEPDPADT